MTRYRTSFDTPEQVLTEALSLGGLMAPDEDEAQACAMLAEEIAADNGFDKATVELAKAAAMERFEFEAQRKSGRERGGRTRG